jgi:hypothetical protein
LKDPPDIFGEVGRECNEEIKHLVIKKNLRLFSVGIDPRRFVFQCSFIERTELTSRDILDAAREAKTRQEIAELVAEPFELSKIGDLVKDRAWEPAAEAGLVTLAAKRFGEDRVRMALS